MAKVAREALEQGLTGLEFASGIPGTIGGGIVMNAGAYDGEMESIVESVTVLNEDGEFMVLDHDTMEFGYRSSIIKNRPFIVVEAVLKLEQGDKDSIKEKMDDWDNIFKLIRDEKIPLLADSISDAEFLIERKEYKL